MNYVPQINSLFPKPTYLGYEVSLGETPAHFENRPALQRIDGKKIAVVCIGASTPDQVMTPFAAKNSVLKDVKIINCCVWAEDINKWLDVNGNGWMNVDSKLKAAGVPYSRVQSILFCADDLRDKGTGVAAIETLRDKMLDFIALAKSKFVNLRQIDLFSRFCEYRVTDLKFGSPTGYNYGFGQKLVVERSAQGQTSGVWVTDATGYLWTDGETMRSDGFQFFWSWMRQDGANVHMDTNRNGDEICADYIFNNMKRYTWFK